MAINRYYSAIAQDTTLTSVASNSTASMVVGATTGFPTSYPFVLAIDYGMSSEELVSVTGVAGLTLTVTRGFNGTTAVSHAVGAVVRHVIVAQDMTEMQAHLASTTGAHGVTGAVVGTTDVQTLTNKDLTASTNTFPTKLVTTTGSQTLTNKTIDYTANTITNLPSTLPSQTGQSGKYLTTDGTNASWASITLAIPALTFNAQTGTTYTLVSGDVNKLVTLSNASAVTVTVPNGVFTSGQQINLQSIGAGQTTIASDGTTTITSTPGLKLRAQYSSATLICTGTNTFTLVGDLSA